jgi:hypothetical protein
MELPNSRLLQATAFDIDHLILVADHVIAGIVHRHPLNVFEYEAQNPFCNMNPEE